MSVTVGDCAVRIVGTPCLVRGSGQTADDPRGCVATGFRPGVAEDWKVEDWDVEGRRAGAWDAAAWDAGRTAGGGEVGDRSSDVELAREVAAVGGGGAARPRSKDVEPAGDDPRGGAAVPRSNDVEPGDPYTGGGVAGRIGCPLGVGPVRSSEVLPLPDRGGADDADAGDDGRPVGAGPDRSNDVLDALVVTPAAGADRWAATSDDDCLPEVSDRAAAPDRGAGSDPAAPAGRVE